MRLKLGRGWTRHHRIVALVSLAVALAFAASAERSTAATADRTIMFVVDTSTSMTGAPLAEAKSALVDASSGIPLGTRVGLRSYSGPCDAGGADRVPLGPFDRATFASGVQSLSIGPSGTPTPAALRAAASLLPSTGDRTIVLVSDGQSSCGSPCPVARELAGRLGAGFRIDTVGFRAPGSAETELECVARVTGGRYVPVRDPVRLRQALTRATAARVTELRLLPRAFVAASKGASFARAKVGTQVLYALSDRARVRFTVERAAPGRRVKGKCRRPTARTKRARRCTRYVKLRGSFYRDGNEGKNLFRFRGRLRGKKLRPGRYRLVATAIDAAGNPANALGVRFRIVRR